MDGTRKVALAAATTGLLAVGVMVPALAQDLGSGTETNADDRDERRAEHQEAFAEALAAELDLDVDTVSDAIAAVHERLREQHAADRQTAFEDRLDAAVESGDLTQEQADAILEARESGVLPFGRGGRGWPGGAGDGPRGHHGGMGGMGGGMGGGFPAPPEADTDPDPAA